jgi:ketosteroid isomerase-like protein
MSQENVEIVREIYDGFAHRDSAMPFRFYAPNIEWDASRYHPLGQFAVYHGHDGVRALFSDFAATIRDFEFQALDLTPTGDHVLVTVGERGVGRESGVPVDGRHYALWTLRDGIVTRVCTFLDQGEALRAGGLCG